MLNYHQDSSILYAKYFIISKVRIRIGNTYIGIKLKDIKLKLKMIRNINYLEITNYQDITSKDQTNENSQIYNFKLPKKQ